MIPNLSHFHLLDTTTLVQLMSKGCRAQCLQHHGIRLHWFHSSLYEGSGAMISSTVQC